MNNITIIGLGNYGLDELPLGIYKYLKDANVVYARTTDHPVVDQLPEVTWKSFDYIYESYDQFYEVYEAIVEELVELSRVEPIIYAVPGHPIVAETTTQLLLKRKDVVVEIMGGKSFIDDLFTTVGYDPNDGFTMLDATDIAPERINIRTSLIVTQVYNQIVASDLKITLMEKYPDNHEVIIVTGASNSSSVKKTVPLYELDHDFESSNLTSVFVPSVTGASLNIELSELINVMGQLTSEKGCPWDKEQTHQSLRRYLIEESYELIEAIDSEDIDHMIEELGDVLLQVVFHATIAKNNEWFRMEDIVKSITDKMVRRHPHVFSDAQVNSIDDLYDVWNDVKKEEGKVERTVKMEKQFANLFMALYDKVQNGYSLERALEEVNYETR